jgi:hypothetical protein
MSDYCTAELEDAGMGGLTRSQRAGHTGVESDLLPEVFVHALLGAEGHVDIAVGVNPAAVGRL